MSQYQSKGLLVRVLRPRALAGGALAMIAGVVGFTSVSEARRLLEDGTRSPAVPMTTADSAASVRVNPFESAHGTHLVVYVVTVSNCGWSTLPSAMEAIGRLRTELIARHSNRYAAVRVVAVSLDRDLAAGLAFLNTIGDGDYSRSFDQIVIGGSWLNEHVERLVWRDSAMAAISPQVVIVERPVDSRKYMSEGRLTVGADRSIGRIEGTGKILEWMDAGFPLGLSEPR